MRRPSLFVRLLVVMAGAFFVLAFSFMGEPIPALVSFLFFSFFWLVLESVGRDPSLQTEKARRYFKLIIVFGVVAMIAAFFYFITALVNRHFEEATRSLATFVFMAGVAWRYRGQWKAWLRK